MIITEARNDEPDEYLEITNKGDKTIDLAEIELGRICPWWTLRWIPEVTVRGGMGMMMLPHYILAPGESFVAALAFDYNPKMWKTDPVRYAEVVTQPQMYNIANMMVHVPEATSPTPMDSVTPGWQAMYLSHASEGWYLRHHYVNTAGEKDSMLIDQFNMVMDPATGYPMREATPIAGVADGGYTHHILRRNSVTTGISEFSSHEANYDAADLQFEKNKGIGLDDSEWMPVPHLSGAVFGDVDRDVLWTVGNSVDIYLDENTLVKKPVSKVVVDLDNATITVPWGIRYNDSIMHEFVRKPGLAWHYTYAGTSEDSAYCSIRTGDTLTLYMCGNQLTTKKLALISLDPTKDDNKVISKSTINYGVDWTGDAIPGSPRYTISYPRSPYFTHIFDGVNGMDTISRIVYATRVDTLFKYLEKPPKATWKIVYKNALPKPDLNTGDILRVTSESGKVKNYYLKCAKYLQSINSDLSSITWPDMPDWYKGDLSKAYGWKGDTIPGFASKSLKYQIKIPMEYDGIPALTYTKADLNSRVVVTRATTLKGTVADRTVTFTVYAENSTMISVYTVEFVKERDYTNVQPWIGEPFISRYFFADTWTYNLMEIANPGTEPLDLSNYMIVANLRREGSLADIFKSAQGLAANDKDAAFVKRYNKYIPGRKWAQKPDFIIAPFVAQQDLAHNPIVQPGEVFTISSVARVNWIYTLDANGRLPYNQFIDMDFVETGWVDELGVPEIVDGDASITGMWYRDVYLLKILNDSVKNGTKWALDINDFKVIDVTLSAPEPDNNVTFVGITSDHVIDPAASFNMDQVQNNFRKPWVWKGNPVKGASMGASWETNEWEFKNSAYMARLGDPSPWIHIWQGIGSHVMDEVTFNQSTVTSKWYKVSPGYGQSETIKGVKTGTTVSDFLANLVKKNPLQTLTVKSGVAVLPPASAVITGSVLTVLSADSTNTSKYVLDVTVAGLSANALLTSTVYTINVKGATGTVAGFAPGTLLKDVVAGVIVPAGATLTVTDASDAYMSLSKLTYDTTYVDVQASTNVYFKVVAENFANEIVYQLTPNVKASDAFVTSDVYSVDQDAALIQFLPSGTTVASLSVNVYPAPGATFVVLDKAGFVREVGGIYQDDKLLVTAADGVTKKAYFFSMLNYKVNTYLAYVTSDAYKVDQVNFSIKLPTTSAGIAEFYSKLLPSYGASLMVIDANGNPSGNAFVQVGDRLQVVAADNNTTTTYLIGTTVGVSTLDKNEVIKMYPNPTIDRVVIQGLASGNRVRVFNAVGVTLRDVKVTNSTEYVSLAAQPAGIYVFVISDGEKFINIQKIIKK